MEGLLRNLNGRWHAIALLGFMVGIVGHMGEHVVQILQLYALGLPISESRGVVGEWIPWLATSEAMHYFYAIYTLAGLVLLAPAFRGRAQFWWNAALLFQFWHHFEHVLLLYQVVTGNFFFGATAPTSIVQVFISRAELHFMYNTIVFVPMIVALCQHFGRRPDATDSLCDCSTPMPAALQLEEAA